MGVDLRMEPYATMFEKERGRPIDTYSFKQLVSARVDDFGDGCTLAPSGTGTAEVGCAARERFGVGPSITKFRGSPILPALRSD
jgi:hypothetical protein